MFCHFLFSGLPHPSARGDMAGWFQPPFSEHTSHPIFEAFFYLREVKKTLIPSLPFNPNYEIMPTANDIFLAKLQMNLETNLSVTIKALSMQNHDTNFVSPDCNLFRVTPFEWQRRVGTKILDEHTKGYKIFLLCMRPTVGGKTLLYQTVAAYLKVVCLYI